MLCWRRTASCRSSCLRPVSYTHLGVNDPLSLSKLNYYVSQLHEVDAFVGALYRAVMDLNEETVLVFYGDHLPSLAKDAALTLTKMCIRDSFYGGG